MAIQYRKFPKVNNQIIQKFWSKVAILQDENACWLWLGGTIPQRGNYGRFYIYRKDFRAHRVAYFFASNVDPGEFDVMHSCDNPPCCNPKHLSLGTRADNHRDMRAKKRWRRKDFSNTRRGEKQWLAKHTEAEILEIRRLYNTEHLLQREIAVMFNTKQGDISNIVRRKTWKHI